MIETINKIWYAYVDGSYHADDRPNLVGMGIVLMDPNGNVVVKQGKCTAQSSLVEMQSIGGEIGVAYLGM